MFGARDVVGKPQVDIQVDDATGRWSVDALPMILMPQHFFLNNHFAVEAVLGPERLAEVLRPAGYRSAYDWCEKEATYHRLRGLCLSSLHAAPHSARLGPIQTRRHRSRRGTRADSCRQLGLCR